MISGNGSTGIISFMIFGITRSIKTLIQQQTHLLGNGWNKLCKNSKIVLMGIYMGRNISMKSDRNSVLRTKGNRLVDSVIPVLLFALISFDRYHKKSFLTV